VEALRTLFPTSNFTLLAVVLGLPAIGALVNGVFGKRLGREGVRLMALTAIFGAFLASALTFLLLPASGEPLTWELYRWFAVEGRVGQPIPIDVAFSVNGMNATMMLIITGVGFLIHLYSTKYMEHDEGYHRFFAYLNLFCFAMLVLVMGANLPILFIGWEGVGVCSYLLIGFWFEDDKNASAGKKAFITNRIGDFGLLVAMAMLAYYGGALSFQGIETNAQSLLTQVRLIPSGAEWAMMHPSSWAASVAPYVLPERAVTASASTLIALMIFLGCAGKSAQLPLYVWLPDAMAGPTPVSALIHAATMVTAGVYLVARMAPVFLLSPAAMATVAVVGVLTAFLAATMALFQTDLKKVLAYSTVSQLGFMFIGVGVGAYTAGFFHVFTHAFFKACLFLGAGSVIFAMHKQIHHTEASQDMRNMGGLAQYMPLTRWSFLASCFAIAGFPLTSGFWSKDEILWKAYSTMPATPSATFKMWAWPTWLGPTIYWVAILAATMTAFYMFRAYFMTFHGKFKGWTIVEGAAGGNGNDHHDDDHHPGAHHHHEPLQGPAPVESPWAMTLPLVVLGAFAAFAGFLNAEPIHVAPLAHLLEPMFTKAEHVIQEREGARGMMWAMMLPGFAAFLAGTGFALYTYLNRAGAPERAFAARFPKLYQLLVDKWRIDELYDATVLGMVDALADIFVFADKWIIDGILAKLVAALAGASGTVLRAFQTGRVQVYSTFMVVGLAGLGWFYVQPHARIAVADQGLRATGHVVLTAPAGLGYSYRWEGAGLTANKDFSQTTEVSLSLAQGEKKEVQLFVKNAFGRVAKQEVSLSRPASGSGARLNPAAPEAPELPAGLRVPARGGR
jgi:NADH-quinone oxidoreductase subunit L